MLYYMTILFPNSAETAEQENPGLLPCRSAEIVIHTRTPTDGSDGADITQLVVQCKSRIKILVRNVLFADVFYQSIISQSLMRLEALRMSY